MAEEKVIVGILDESCDDEYMYQRVGESKAEYEVRMVRVRAALEARVTDEEKRLAAELLENV